MPHLILKVNNSTPKNHESFLEFRQGTCNDLAKSITKSVYFEKKQQRPSKIISEIFQTRISS